LGNLNALAMEPLGHIAGMAASFISGTATLFGTLVCIPVGLMFAGTPVPLATASVVFCAIATLMMLWLRNYERRTGRED
jgi:DHA1 family bicyclomycin/chloramphenicol resistance-like MFS transporter